jgi:hypothetical protein
MECPTCRAEIRDGSKICNQCGAALPLRCPSCAQANAPNAKFCSECGTPLGGPPASLAPDSTGTRLPVFSTAERRQLTVMFCDLVGSTALSARLDPEEMQMVLRAYQNAVTGEIARIEGYVAIAGLLLARLDRSPAMKAVAQIAACIGREFDDRLLAPVASLPPTELNAGLDMLVQAELIFRRGIPPKSPIPSSIALCAISLTRAS